MTTFWVIFDLKMAKILIKNDKKVSNFNLIMFKIFDLGRLARQNYSNKCIHNSELEKQRKLTQNPKSENQWAGTLKVKK